MSDAVAVDTHGKGRSASAQDNRTGRTREIPSLSSGLMNQTCEIPSLFASWTNHARETPSLFSGATLPVLDMLRSPLEHRTSQEVLYGFLNARAAVRNQSRVSCPETRGSLKAPARSRTGAASHELSRWLYDARGQSASRSILRRSTCKPYAPRWADNAENRPDRPAVADVRLHHHRHARATLWLTDSHGAVAPVGWHRWARRPPHSCRCQLPAW